MRTKILLLLSVAMAIYLTSCSSDNNTTNPTPSGDFYKLDVGNYWVYTTTETDPETNEKTVTQDSTVITGQEMKEGKNAFKLKAFTESEDVSESYQYSENGVLYTLLDNFLPDDGLFPIPDDLYTNSWIKIADPNATSWEILTITLKDVPVELMGTNITASGTIKLNATKGDKVIVNVLGKDYTAQKYTIISNISASTSFGGVPININVNVPTHFYYADGIGLVKTQTESTEVNLVFTTIKTPATESVLIRYKLK